MRVRTIFGFVLTAVICIAALRVSSSADKGGSEISKILYTSAPEYEAQAWIRGGERFPRGSQIISDNGSSHHQLVNGFASTADPNVSFDGLHVLFAGKEKASDRWQIWEVSIEGGAPRRVLTTTEDAVRPLYLPDGRLVYARKVKGQFLLETASLDGKEVLRLSYAPGSALPSDVLRDGRILFQAGQPIGPSHTPELYTVYSDGSGVESYRCDHGHARYAGRQVATGDIVFASGTALGRFTSPLAHEVAVAAPAGEYAGDVADTGTGEWLVSWRTHAKAKYEIRRVHVDSSAMKTMAADSSTNLVQPTVVAARPVPNRHPSGLHDWKYANLLALNSYTSRPEIPEGSIAKVRVYTLGTNGRPKLLGTAPVEKDGSLYVRVPGNVPLQFELQDSAGKTLKRQAGWFWARGGEQRVCVGCHAGPEQSPENAVPAVLLKSTRPANLSAD